MWRLLAACLLALVALVAPASEKQTGPLVEKVTVHLAQFDVVVRDRNGSFVRGLVADDFEVREDGAPLEVTALDAWTDAGGAGGARSPAAPSVDSPDSAGVPPEPIPVKSDPGPAPEFVERRAFVILFDNLNGTSAMRLSQAKSAAERFALDHIADGDLAAVYQMDLSLRTVVPFSSDPREIASGIRKVTWFPASTFSEQISETILGYQSKGTAARTKERVAQSAQLEGERLDWTREHAYRTIRDLSGVFDGISGRRILVLVSAGFPLTAAGDVERGRGGFTESFRDLIKALGRLGIAVYSIDVGDDMSTGDVSARIDWRVAAGKLGMEESFLADVGLDASFGAGAAGARREFLGVIANETGGRLLTSSDARKAFETIQAESANFYRVSCRVPDRSDDGRYRRITIAVRRPGVVVTARRGRYSDVYPNAGARPASGGASSQDAESQRPIRLKASATPLPPGPDGRRPVSLIIEATGPVDLAVDEDGSAKLDLELLALARENEEPVDRYGRTLSARIRPEGVSAVRRGFRVEGRFDLPAGRFDLQVTLRIVRPPQVGIWAGTLAIPPSPTGTGLRFAGGFLSSQADSEIPLLLRAEAPEGPGDPLELAPNHRLLPPTDTAFLAGRPIDCVFWLEGVPIGPQPPELAFSVHAVDSEGRRVTPPTQLLMFGPEGARLRGLIRMDSTAITPGPWNLEISASRNDPSGAPAAIRLPFSIGEAPLTGSRP